MKHISCNKYSVCFGLKWFHPWQFTQFTSEDSQALEQELERHHSEDELWPDVEETCHFAHLHPFPFFCLCKRGNQGGCCQFTPTSFLLTDILKHFLPYLGAFGIPPAARLFLAEPGWLVQKVIQVKPGLGRNWFV